MLFFVGLFAASYVAVGEARASDMLNTDGMFSIVGDRWFQMRIEQRVIIRVPRQRSTPVSIAVGSTNSEPIKFREKKIGKCLIMDRLIGSRPGPNESLELVTRDGVMVRAYLGDGCLASEFYAGAYMEKPQDGKLCVDRDLLHARTGAKCEINKFRMLVPD
jgi:hypothetical protein